jgi:hypothetical protein
MKFMMMMNMPRGDGEYQINQWTPEAFNAHIQFMKDLNRELQKTGEFVEAQGLAPPVHARIVKCGPGGAPLVSDGPFAETKEFLAGFWIIQVDKRERAYEIAAKASSAPGPDGKPLVIPIELREVMGAPLPDQA